MQARTLRASANLATSVIPRLRKVNSPKGRKSQLNGRHNVGSGRIKYASVRGQRLVCRLKLARLRTGERQPALAWRRLWRAGGAGLPVLATNPSEGDVAGLLSNVPTGRDSRRDTQCGAATAMSRPGHAKKTDEHWRDARATRRNLPRIEPSEIRHAATSFRSQRHRCRRPGLPTLPSVPRRSPPRCGRPKLPSASAAWR